MSNETEQAYDCARCPKLVQGTLHQERLTQGFCQRNENIGTESKFGKGNLGGLDLIFPCQSTL